ncbi:MAG: oxaloacetate decarboxylase [Oceanospirillales bacterium]|uniref:Probable oxaloacetate decarboxylase gamma chain n=1 Tax=Marinobacterium halophilum TaxID=267374 RepID=A0A2P8EQQ8_9GAMM|nr:OadG family protein [Marinobacterium halophilum]MBR9827719.1 oxaloacetate decarboxylase [Oceanospirillales bacterium]PSL11784.1 oxaloacetate decarboxylase gamma subunit [Marinobacterium halophilum]
MDNLFSEGLTLMAFGMGFVFVFLTLLVLVTGTMSRLVTRFVPEPVAKAPKARPRPAAAGSAGNNDELVAVITAAVHKYRK